LLPKTLAQLFRLTLRLHRLCFHRVVQFSLVCSPLACLVVARPPENSPVQASGVVLVAKQSAVIGIGICTDPIADVQTSTRNGPALVTSNEPDHRRNRLQLAG
jgi:hypothetical protein